MSYILDALKKVEHEKNKKVRSDGRVCISGDLFHERPHSSVKTGKRTAGVLIAGILLLASAGVWFALQGNGRQSITLAPAVAPQQPAVVSSPVVPQAEPAAVQSISVPVPVPSVGGTGVPAAADEDEDDSSSRQARRLRRLSPPPPSPAALNQPVQAAQAPADIKLSGIAWQDERSVRRAVVNGFLLKEGAVIAGARIIDIQADKVRFSSAGGTFEIKLDAVLPGGGQR